MVCLVPEYRGLSLSFIQINFIITIAGAITFGQNMNSNSKVILVTGASSGIGLAVARVLTQKGHRVFGTSRSDKVGPTPDGFEMICMDVTDENAVVLGIEHIRKAAGKLDVVVNNAGLGMVGPVELVSDAEAREIFETNVFGVLNVCRHVLPLMRSSGGGHIINITSIAAQMGLPFRGIYSSSKFAVEGFSESLSQEVRQFGIKVSIIEPGDFKTNINQNRRVAARVNQSVYQDQQAIVLNQINREVSASRTPEAIGYRIASIIEMNNPRLRFRVATLMQRFSITLMRILPSRVFEKLVMKHYKIPDK